MIVRSFIIGIVSSILLYSSFSVLSVSAAGDFEIVPESKQKDEQIGTDVDYVAGTNNETGSVWDRYNNKAKGYGKNDDTGSMFATGIFTWDGILDYLVKIIRFLSQLALIIGAAMIIYNGYEYALASFNGKDPGTKRIKDAIYGILIVIFSYAIIQALKSAFL